MRTVLITGASCGLGRALAYVFYNNNVSLVLQHNTHDLPFMDCASVKGDIRSEHTLIDIVDAAKKCDVDILINNAGIYLKKPFIECEEKEIVEVIEPNLIAPIRIIKRILPIFIEKQSGLIVNINSMAGKRGSKEETVYCASKFGLSGFSAALKYECVTNNIEVIDIFLGAMKTQMTAARVDRNKLIPPKEVAEEIYNICGAHNGYRIPEITINRNKY